MKALTLKAPWAQAIVHGDKRIENRTWKPYADVIGERIAIHCGKSIADAADYDYPDRRAQAQLEKAHEIADAHGVIEAGHIIGTVRVVGWVGDDGGCLAKPDSGFSQDWRVLNHAPFPGIAAAHATMDSPWWLGPIGWLLDDVRAVEPVPARGMPGLWTVPDEIELVTLTEEVSR